MDLYIQVMVREYLNMMEFRWRLISKSWLARRSLGCSRREKSQVDWSGQGTWDIWNLTLWGFCNSNL